MGHRINGTGMFVTPLPEPGKVSIAMQWFTLFFIPLIPIGWILVRGAQGGGHIIIKKLSYREVKKTLGVKKMLLTLGYSFYVNFILLICFMVAALIIALIKSCF